MRVSDGCVEGGEDGDGVQIGRRECEKEKDKEKEKWGARGVIGESWHRGVIAQDEKMRREIRQRNENVPNADGNRGEEECKEGMKAEVIINYRKGVTTGHWEAGRGRMNQ